MKKILAVTLLALTSLSCYADDWTAVFGLRVSKSSYSSPAEPSETKLNTLTTTLIRKVDAKTQVGGVVGFTDGKTTAIDNSNNSDNQAKSIALFAVRDLGSMRYVDVSAGYGLIKVDGRSRGNELNSYNSDADFTSFGLGITQYLPIKPDLTASLGVRSSYSKNNMDTIVDSAAIRNSSFSSSTRTINSVGAGLNWQLGLWSPAVRLDYARSNQALIRGVDDRDFYRYALSTGYKLDQKTKVNVGYGGVFGKAHSKEDSILFSVSKSF